MFSAQHKFGRLGAPAGRSLEAQIAALFPDVWYDPSDLTTLFQDSAGTTPVTAVEQPVGLMLDKSRGLVLGPELVVNGDFSSGATGWTVPSGWSIAGGKADAVSIGGTTYLQQALSPTARWYEISFDVVQYTAGDLRIFFAGQFSTTLSGSLGKKTARFFSDGVPTTVRISASTAAFTGSIDNISVREIPGNHATNIPGDTTTRPVTKAGVLLNFDGANDGMVSSTGGGATSGFAFITAIKLQGGSKTQTVFSDAGTNAGFRVRINSSNQLELSAGNGSTFVSAATTDTLSVGTTAVIAAWHDGANLNVQVNNGTVAQQSLASATAGTAGFTLGRDNGASSSFMQAQTSAMLYAKKVLTASQIAVAKRYCAQKAGVAL